MGPLVNDSNWYSLFSAKQTGRSNCTEKPQYEQVLSSSEAYDPDRLTKEETSVVSLTSMASLTSVASLTSMIVTTFRTKMLNTM